MEITAVNIYVGEVQTEIEGEKTWTLEGHDIVLSESIMVLLKYGDRVVKEAAVNLDGKEIVYTITKTPIADFALLYNGFDIVNIYIPPVEIDPPATEFVFLLRGENDVLMPEGSTKVVAGKR